VTDNNEIKTVLQQRKILFGEQEKVLDDIIENGKQSGEKIRSIIVVAEKIKEQVKINKNINEILSKNTQEIPPELYVKLAPLMNQDKTILSSLKEHDSQIVSLNFNLNTVDTSFNAIPFLAASSTSSTVYFSSFLDHPTLKQELIKVHVHLFENIEFIKKELKQFSADRSEDFESDIKDWFATSNSKLKYKSLLNLRSVFFYQLFDDLCPESDYTKTIWYNKISKNERKKRYCQVKFFILGYSDENVFPEPQKNQIKSLAQDMQQSFNDMSDIGKTGLSGSSLDVLFEKVITNFRVILQLRKSFYKYQN
jgi:hypothetical protein